MLFGTKAPLWKYIFGIFTLAIGAQQVATAVVVFDATPPLLRVATGVQVVATLTVAFGLFRVVSGALVAGAALALSSAVLALAAGFGATAGGGLVPAVLAILALIFDRLPGGDAPTQETQAGESRQERSSRQ